MTGPLSHAKSGFTLIEIIVATTILGLALVAVLQVFSIGISSARKSQRMTMAVSIARNLMEEVISRDDIEDGYDRGSIEEFGIEYSIDIRPAEYEGLHEVEVAVTWSDAMENREYQLVCYVPEEAQGFSVFPR
ncbi:MAG: prepilin-type N-terminal cleavage/methylation domain-containing protein [Candidatus Glassbacteria bacterium]